MGSVATSLYHPVTMHVNSYLVNVLGDSQKLAFGRLPLTCSQRLLGGSCSDGRIRYEYAKAANVLMMRTT